jgi:4-hydroxy-tetrahydrodipicolinate synthase
MIEPGLKQSLRGVTVATVMPFTTSNEIDWKSYERVLDYCARPEGIAAVFVNGHAGEGASLSSEERAEVICRTRRQIGNKALLSGVIANSVEDAVAQARSAEEAGADCAVLFPPAGLGGGAAATPRAPIAFVRAVTKQIGIPVSIFQYPLASGFGFSTETLIELAHLPGVVAIKEGSDNMQAYEENWVQVKARCPHVSMLASNFHWFLAQLAVGSDGILSGLASLTPHWLVALWRAAEANDLAAMRRESNRLRPLVRAIYGSAPMIDMHTRIKVGLQALGLIDNADPRLPLVPVADEVRKQVESAVKVSDLHADWGAQ